MGARRLELSAADLYLDQAIKDGRARKTPLSMKKLGNPPDPELQTRIGIDMDHVHKLGTLVDSGTELNPIVVFEFPNEDYRLLIANGFHRHRLFQIRKHKSIPAWVVHDSMEQAILYAASANLQFSKPLSPEDKRKALYKILDRETLAGMTHQEMATYCGLHKSTVARLIIQYCQERGIDVDALRGGRALTVNPGEPLQYRVYGNRGTPTGYLIYKGKLSRYYGKDSPETRARFENEKHKILSQIEREKKPLSLIDAKAPSPRNLFSIAEKPSLSSGGEFVNWLVRRGIEAKTAGKTGNPLAGIVSPGAVYMVLSTLNAKSIFGAIGQVLLLRLRVDSAALAAVVCYPAEADRTGRSYMRDAEALGVRFMEPMALVAELGPKDDAQPEDPR